MSSSGFSIAALTPAGVLRRAADTGRVIDPSRLKADTYGTNIIKPALTEYELHSLFDPYLYARDREIVNPAFPLVRAAGEQGLKIAFAESCTGGLAGALVTAVPGSSGCFWGSMVTYANEAKERVLEVSTLVDHGAVSEATVRAMVEGTLRLSGADAALAISGIAGPGGGSAEKPVGTVWFAFGFRGRIEAFKARLSGGREDVRAKAAALACCALADQFKGALLDSKWIAEYTFS